MRRGRHGGARQGGRPIDWVVCRTGVHSQRQPEGSTSPPAAVLPLACWPWAKPTIAVRMSVGGQWARGWKMGLVIGMVIMGLERPRLEQSVPKEQDRW